MCVCVCGCECVFCLLGLLAVPCLEQSFCAKYVIYIKKINLFKELSHLYVKNVSNLSSIIGLSFQFLNFIIVL